MFTFGYTEIVSEAQYDSMENCLRRTYFKGKTLQIVHVREFSAKGIRRTMSATIYSLKELIARSHELCSHSCAKVRIEFYVDKIHITFYSSTILLDTRILIVLRDTYVEEDMYFHGI